MVEVFQYHFFSGGCFYESQWTRLRLYVDGNDCGYRSVKIESSMGQVESLLKVTNDPVDFMCQVCRELYTRLLKQRHLWTIFLARFFVPALQSLRIGSKPMLDDYLSKQFLERVPKSGFPILTSVANTSASHFQVSSFLTSHCTHFCAHFFNTLQS